jgi:hypothetical protein
VEAPDFMHLQQLQECLLETGVQLDYSALCVERKGSDRELQTCLDRLVVGGHFLQALKLARTAGLPRDAVVIAQVLRYTIFLISPSLFFFLHYLLSFN